MPLTKAAPSMLAAFVAALAANLHQRLLTPTSYMLLLLPLLIEPMALFWRPWIYGSASRCRRPWGRQWSLPPQADARLSLDIER